MPQVAVTDWSHGPMGPGFFMLFPGTRITTINAGSEVSGTNPYIPDTGGGFNAFAEGVDQKDYKDEECILGLALLVKRWMSC